MSSHRSPTVVYEKHPGQPVSGNGNGTIRISPKAAGLILTLVIAVGGGITSAVQLIRWIAHQEQASTLNTEFRLRQDTALTNHRFRVNQVLTDQERRLRELEVRAGLRRRVP